MIQSDEIKQLKQQIRSLTAQNESHETKIKEQAAEIASKTLTIGSMQEVEDQKEYVETLTKRIEKLKATMIESEERLTKEASEKSKLLEKSTA